MRCKVVSSILMLAVTVSAMSQTPMAVDSTVVVVPAVTVADTVAVYDGTAADSITADVVATDTIIAGMFGPQSPVEMDSLDIVTVEEAVADTVICPPVDMPEASSLVLKPMPAESIYRYPYSMTFSMGDWKRMWTNTCVLSGAYVATLLVLECLPPDATAWNRAEIRNVPLFKRWYNHVIKQGPEWDHDNPVFNYILHPYAGAAYFMACRSTGFNFWQSFLYSAAISTIGWEFGIEAFMERPSVQDLFITPCVGSAIGEMFYRVKRGIVANDYELAGSKLLGNVVAFLVDPVNEVVDIFRGRNTAKPFGYEITTQISPSSVTLLVSF